MEYYLHITYIYIENQQNNVHMKNKDWIVHGTSYLARAWGGSPAATAIVTAIVTTPAG